MHETLDASTLAHELRRSQERLRALGEATGHIVWTSGAEGLVTGDLPQWRAFTGQSAQAIRGLGWLEAVHPDDRERISREWAHAAEEDALFETQYRVRRSDGEYSVMQLRACRVSDAAGADEDWGGVCVSKQASGRKASVDAGVEQALD